MMLHHAPQLRLRWLASLTLFCGWPVGTPAADLPDARERPVDFSREG
jgi:hypothetical protein